MFQNKTLLMLGSNVSSDDIVRYAREQGAYTIVADYYPPERSYAKRLAHEGVLVSTQELETLSRLVEERRVDGVLAGISEGNLLSAMTLAEKHGLPFYCSRAQWERIENKGEFRRLCESNGVPCPKTYYIGGHIPEVVARSLCFPVVVKPVDSSGSAGVRICTQLQELREAEAAALACSDCGQLILEQFIKGQEFTAHYTIHKGKPSLSCVDNRYPVAIHGGNVTTIPVARIYPSLFLEEYIAAVDGPMRRLCSSLGMENGVVFVQGLYDPEAGFSIFEAGLRSAGEAPYRFLSKINGVNYMQMLTEQALLGKSLTFRQEREDPFLKGKCCGVVSFVAKGGRVGQIHGLEAAVADTPSVIEYENRYPVGSETPCGDTLRQIMLRFVMICDSRQEMARDIAYLNAHITVLNDQGEDMVIKMDPSRVFDIY